MEILTHIAQVRALLNAARARGETVGVMGTSGRMHEGHLSLLRRAVQETDLAIMFWMGDVTFSWADHRKTPALCDRDWNVDRELCESTGVRYAYLPHGDDYMPRPPMTVTLVPQLSRGCPPMEDAAHLDQVASATAKLFNIFGRMRYYCGEKDWQQLVMIKRMAEDLSAEVEVICCPTVREADGLAMSSRNVKLTKEERARAPSLYAALCAGRAMIDAGERSTDAVERCVRERLSEVGDVVYAYCLDADTLQRSDRVRGHVRLLASLKLGAVQLVDNVGAWAD